MKRLFVLFALVGAMAFGSAVVWKAEAAPMAGAAPIAVSAWTINDIVHAACRGHRGAHCPPGYVWNGHRCRPC